MFLKQFFEKVNFEKVSRQQKHEKLPSMPRVRVNNVYLQPCNYQLSKSIVHEIKFGEIINNLPYNDRYFNTDWQFEMFKRGKSMDMILV